MQAQAPQRTPNAMLEQATVTVAGRCAGAVLSSKVVVLTAAHCVKEHDVRLPIRFFDGVKGLAEVASVDRDRDMALLWLEVPAHVEGLTVADALPRPGTALYFLGRPDRGETLQEASVVKLGRCPSLPSVPDAVFTSMRGTPGDSGAPIVDRALRIVGLVHGGARCSIAAPTSGVNGMLGAVLPAPLQTSAGR